MKIFSFSKKLKKTRVFLKSGDYSDKSIAILGLPYDKNGCFRKGARFGPGSIREFSENLESFSMFSNRDLVDVNFADLGDLDIATLSRKKSHDLIIKAVTEILERGNKSLFFGGDHSITFPIISAFHNFFSDLCIIQFDAHGDLRMEFKGNPLSNACAMGNCLKLFEDQKSRLYQLGIRSMDAEEYALARKLGTLFDGKRQSIKKLISRIGARPVYITLDIDIFDPAFCPGTGTPEAGGWSYRDFEKNISLLSKLNIIGADIVELAPNLDKSGASSALAAKIAREMLLNFFK